MKGWKDFTQRVTDVTKNMVGTAQQYQQRLNNSNQNALALPISSTDFTESPMTDILTPSSSPVSTHAKEQVQHVSRASYSSPSSRMGPLELGDDDEDYEDQTLGLTPQEKLTAAENDLFRMSPPLMTTISECASVSTNQMNNLTGNVTTVKETRLPDPWQASYLDLPSPAYSSNFSPHPPNEPHLFDISLNPTLISGRLQSRSASITQSEASNQELALNLNPNPLFSDQKPSPPILSSTLQGQPPTPPLSPLDRATNDTYNSVIMQTLQSVPREKLEKALESALRRLGNLTNQLKEKEIEASAAQEVAAQSTKKLQVLQDQFDLLEVQLQEEKDRVQELVCENEAKVADLKGMLTESEKIQSQTATHNEELRQLKTDLTNQVELFAQNANEIKNRYETLVKSHTKLKIEKDDLLDELQKERTSREKIREELQQLQKNQENQVEEVKNDNFKCLNPLECGAATFQIVETNIDDKQQRKVVVPAQESNEVSQTKLDKPTKAVDELSSKLRHVESRVVSLQIFDAQASTELDRKSKKLHEATMNLESATKDLSSLNEMNSSLKAQLDQKTSEVQSLARKLENAERELQKYEQQAVEKRKTPSGLDLDFINQLHEREKSGSLQSNLKDTESGLLQVEEVEAQHENTLKETQIQLRATVIELEDQRNRLAAQVENTEMRLATMEQTSVNEQRSSQALQDCLYQKLSAQEEEIQRVTNRLQIAESDVGVEKDLVTSLLTRLEEKVENIELLTTRCRNLEAELQQTKLMLDKERDLFDGVHCKTSTESDCRSIREAVDQQQKHQEIDLQMEIVHSKRKILELEEQLSSVEQKLEETKAVAEKEYMSLQRCESKLRHELDLKIEEIRLLTERVQSSDIELQNAQDRAMATINVESHSVSVTTFHRSEDFDQLEALNCKLRTTLEDKAAECEELQRKMSRAAQEIIVLNDRLEKLQKDYDISNVEKDISLRDLGKLKETLQECIPIADFEKIQEELRIVRLELSDRLVADELTKKCESCAEKEKEINEVKMELKHLQSELRTTSVRLEDAETELEELNRRFKTEPQKETRERGDDINGRLNRLDELELLNERLKSQITELEEKINTFQPKVLEAKLLQQSIEIHSPPPPPPPPRPLFSRESESSRSIVPLVFVELLQVLEMQAERLGQSDSIEAVEQVMSSVDLVIQTIEERLPDDQRNAVGLGVRRLFDRVKTISETRLLLIKQLTDLQVSMSEKREEIGVLKKGIRDSYEYHPKVTPFQPDATIGTTFSYDSGTKRGVVGPENVTVDQSVSTELDKLKYKIAVLQDEKTELESAWKTSQANVSKLSNQNQRMRALVVQANQQLVESKEALQKIKIKLNQKEEQLKDSSKKLNDLQRQYDIRIKPPTTETLEKLNLKSKPIVRLLVPEVQQIWCCLSLSPSSTIASESTEAPSSPRSDTLLSPRGSTGISWWKEDELEESLKNLEIKTLQEVHYEEISKLQSALTYLETRLKQSEKKLTSVTLQYEEYKTKVCAVLAQAEGAITTPDTNCETAQEGKSLVMLPLALKEVVPSCPSNEGVVAFLTSQLNEERAVAEKANQKILCLEKKIALMKAEAESNDRAIIKSIEANEMDRRAEEQALTKLEFQKTIEQLELNLETAHKRIQALTANLVEEKSLCASLRASIQQPTDSLQPLSEQSSPISSSEQRTSFIQQSGCVSMKYDCRSSSQLSQSANSSVSSQYPAHPPTYEPSPSSAFDNLSIKSNSFSNIKRSFSATADPQPQPDNPSGGADVIWDEKTTLPGIIGTGSHWTREVQQFRRRLQNLEKQLNEEKRQTTLLLQQNELIKNELRKSETLLKIQLQEGSRLTNGVPIEFVRNTIIKFLETDMPSNDEHESLMPVLSTIFALTGNEQKQIQIKRQHLKWIPHIFSSTNKL